MVIKVIDFEYKKIKIPIIDGNGVERFIDEEIKTNKFRILRREINSIEEFSEYANNKGIIYKSRCLLKEPHSSDWLVVNHSFDELYKIKYKKVIGFMKNLQNYEEQPSFEKIKRNGKQKFGIEDKRTSKKTRNKRSSS